MIKTKVQILNEIAAKLGGDTNASLVIEALNNIANALGDTDPDELVTESQALNTILGYVEGGGGGSLSPVLHIRCINGSEYGTFVPWNRITDGHLLNGWKIVNADSTVEFDCIVFHIFADDYDEQDNPIEVDRGYYVVLSGFDISDTVNCTYDSDSGNLYITDPANDASVTLTAKTGE